MIPLKLLVTQAIFAVVLLGGCSDKAEIDALRADIVSAREVAAEAKILATSNQQSIQLATNTANSAMKVAEEAKLSSQEANSKIDRAFKRSMGK